MVNGDEFHTAYLVYYIDRKLVTATFVVIFYNLIGKEYV